MYMYREGEFVTVQNASLPKNRERVERAVYSKQHYNVILHLLPRGLHFVQPIGLLALPSLDRLSVLDTSHSFPKASPRVPGFATRSGSVDLPPAASPWLTAESSGLSDRATLAPHADTLDFT
jgi:hypothetical protein